MLVPNCKFLFTSFNKHTKSKRKKKSEVPTTSPRRPQSPTINQPMTMMRSTTVSSSSSSSSISFSSSSSSSSVFRNLALTIILCFLSLGDNSNVGFVLGQSQQQEEDNDNSYHNQVQHRVREQIRNFMSGPSIALQYWSDYYSLGGFDNDLNGPDRDKVATYLYSMSLSSDYWMPFYGLENGVFLGYFHNRYNTVPRLLYREPGDSGYDLTTFDDDDMYIYKDTCVNKESGEAEECTMVEDGGSYVSCINDCELVKCSSSSNNNNNDDNNPDNNDLFQQQQDCSIHLEGSTEKQDCESQIVWCKNYTIEKTTTTFQQQQQQRLGYVPRTEYCMDSQGLFSQTSNEILLETESGGIQLGNCTYGDGITPVQRNIMGPYASCGEVDDDDYDNNLWCDTTYVGGHTSSDYDPRWRGWYLSSKAAQRPRWSDPYIFFSLKTLGITYTHPIYSKTDQDEIGEGQGRKVFAGVLAADMLLDDISNFLVSAFQNTNFFVAIYEASEPYNMIGISTGSEIVKRVLVDNKSRPCPPTDDENDDDDSDEECTLVQITIDDLNGSIENEILRKSHTVLAENGFDHSRGDDDVIAVKEDDDITHSTAYVPTIAKFDQREANLEWHILVTTPVERDSADTILKGETLFVVICVIASLGCAICLFLGTLFYCKRNERAIRLADFRFTCAFIWWVAFLNLSCLTFLGEITDKQCMLRMWTQYMIASLALSPLFVKAFRTWRLLGTVASSGGRAQMNNFQAWTRTLPIPIAQATILTVFSILDPPVATESITLEGETPIQSIYCGHNSSAYYITQGTFYTILITTGCVLAYLTRNIDTRFADSKELLFAMYNIAFSILMGGTISTLLPLPGEALNVLVTTGVFWVSVFSSVVFVVPRLMAVHSDRQKLEDKLSRMRLQSARNRAGGFAGSKKISFQGDSLHDHEDALKILICSANVGNEEPTMASMKGWIPDGGKCDKVTTLNGRPIEAERFDLIVIGMQESTWSNKGNKGNKKNTGNTVDISTGSIRTNESKTVKTAGDESESTQSVEDQDDKIEAGDLYDASEAFMAAVEGEDTVALRKMEQAILGDQYSLVKEEVRGQMRLHIFALESKVPFLENIKVSGANTGIGNVLANKGGIIVSFLYQKTRFTFLSAHLAAHEGESYYQARCDNVSAILDASKTFKLSQKFDLSLCSHHMFVFGDLNFRTKFAEKIEHEESVNKALELIEKEDFEELYSFDELHKGVKNGDLLIGFETLPCQFHPTFKVERQPGFVYKKQRTPSYTDRILFKTSPGLEGLVKPLAYEPCVDFVTSDHKPIRGAFSIVPNETMGTVDMRGKFRMVFSEMECSNLPAADMNGKSDPYLSFVWDSVDLVEEKRRGFRLPRFLQRTSSPYTSFKSKTLNPKWTNEEIILASTSHSVSSGAVLYVSVYDYDFGAADDLLGTLPLSVENLFSMKECQDVKTVTINSPLQANGRKVGTIKFKVDITKIIG